MICAIRVESENDRILLPYLEANSEESAERLLSQLVVEEARPTIGEVLRRTRRKYRFAGSYGVVLEDVAQEVALQLVKRLRLLKQDPRCQPISSYSRYVAGTAKNVFKSKVDEANPEWLILKNKVNYFFDKESLFAAWSDNHDTHVLCGYQSWRDQKRPASEVEFGRLVDQIRRELLTTDAPIKSLEELPLSQLIRLIFGHVHAPLRKKHLLQIVAYIQGVRHTYFEVAEFESRQMMFDTAYEQPSVATNLEHRQLLKFVWEQLCKLSARQQRALLLNLRLPQGKSALSLFVEQGFITMTQLAPILGLSGSELTKLLESGRPLTDAEIGVRLGVTTQQAQNYRKAARARLLRHLKTYGSRQNSRG
jgi:DNA-directed RNA polymerase specialized sigma24 family protein